MRGLVSWFAQNSVAANLIMVLFLLGGSSTLMFSIKRESFPDIPPDTITVSVLYPGATPEEVEESICVEIEEAVQGIDNVQRIVSTSDESMGSVRIEIVDGADIRKVFDDIKNEVDAIDTFPVDSEEPVIEQMTIEERVIAVAVTGEVDERSLRKLADQVRDEITALAGISKAEVVDGRAYEVSIEVREATLRRLQLTFDDIAAAVRRYSLNLPAGSVQTDGGEILFRSNAQAYERLDFEDIPVRTSADGTRIHVGDVATVTLGFEDVDLWARFDGVPSVMVQVFRTGSQNTPDVAAAVHRYVNETNVGLPDSVQLAVWKDRSVDLQDRMDLLARNGLFGLLLVFLSLALFLRARLAFWVTVGLAAALLGAVWVLPYLGMSLNFLSSFGFILVLGILVDDAIVVAENSDAHQRMGKRPLAAAIDGTLEVFTPVSLAVITTGIAFSPLLRLPGRTGVFAGTIAMVVIVAIAFSLIESLLILPAHLAHESRPRRGVLGRLLGNLADVCAPVVRAWSRFQGFFNSGLELFVARIYQPVLERAIVARYSVLAIGIGFLIITYGLLRGGWIKVSFFPPLEGNNVIAALELPAGSSRQATAAGLAVLMETAEQIRTEIEGDSPGSVVQHIRSTLGAQPGTATGGTPHDSAAVKNRSNLSEAHMELVSSELRDIGAAEIAQLWRERVGERIPLADSLTFTSDQMNTGAPVNVELSGEDFATLELAAQDLKAYIATFPGTFALEDDYHPGKQELKLQVTPSGEALGFTQGEIARQVRQGFYGDEAQRVQLGKDNVKVFVRYAEAERHSLADLEAMQLRLPGGIEVPFSEAATYEMGRSPASIRRIDRQRTIVVTSDLNRTLSNANDIADDLNGTYLPKLAAKYPGVNYRFGGERARQAESFAGLASGMVLSLFMMYGLLALVFRSYFQPLIVMLAIPFGIAGAIWAHFLLGMNLTFLSMIGVLALMGVVVNDSLVMIDFINRYRREHDHAALEAVRRAGPRRFRAIVLTSLTTFAGLTPMLLERSVQAAFVIPMAVSLAFGVAFATVVILVIVPTSYLALHDLQQLLVGAEEPMASEEAKLEHS